MSANLAGRAFLPAAMAVLTLVFTAAAPASAEIGALVQLEGTDGCWRDDGSSGCSDALHLDAPRGIVVSPDGRNVYASAYGTVLTFSRDETTGAITQLAADDGCIGPYPPCATGDNLASTESIATSPRGDHVYVASRDQSAVAVFVRDEETGVLSQAVNAARCISEGFAECRVAHTLGGARDIAFDRRADHAYVAAATDNAVAALHRNQTNGELTQPAGSEGCVRDTDGGTGACAVGRSMVSPYAVAVPRDGRNVYAVSPVSDSIVVFQRDKRTGAISQLAGTDGCASVTGANGCATAETLDGARHVVISKDGKFVYVAGDSVTAFSRDRATGVLSFLSCIREGGGAPCSPGTKLDGASHLRMSRDGHSLYVSSETGHSLAIFSRDRKTGAITQLPGFDACVSADGTGPCLVGRAMISPASIAIDSRGDSLYLVARFSESIGVYERATK